MSQKAKITPVSINVCGFSFKGIEHNSNKDWTNVYVRIDDTDQRVNSVNMLRAAKTACKAIRLREGDKYTKFVGLKVGIPNNKKNVTIKRGTPIEVDDTNIAINSYLKGKSPKN